ncbi:MAG: hypothetical protein GWM87_07240 [Xanthomonadales bacterium]|nr:hypothetical protein [Xanthomonadales bacterium]NIX12749.1 hypothetical protein [Xanthomonadales bacterium]
MRKSLQTGLLALVLTLLTSGQLAAQERPRAAIAPQAYGFDVENQPDVLIGAEAAPDFMHEVVMVCGEIEEAYFERSDMLFSDSSAFAGQRNTFLYFDKPKGEHDFVAVVHGTVRKDLAGRPESLKGHRACVFGKISRYRGRAAMRIIRAEQLSTLDPAELEASDGSDPED